MRSAPSRKAGPGPTGPPDADTPRTKSLVHGSWLETNGKMAAKSARPQRSARPRRAGRFLRKRLRVGVSLTSSSRVLCLEQERRHAPGEVVWPLLLGCGPRVEQLQAPLRE